MKIYNSRIIIILFNALCNRFFKKFEKIEKNLCMSKVGVPKQKNYPAPLSVPKLHAFACFKRCKTEFSKKPF